MYFNSTAFLAFMAVVLTTYYALQVGRRYRIQNWVLLAASYVFYACFDWRLCGLLALSTVLNFELGSRIHSCSNDRGRRRWLLLSVAFNLGVLGFFKYFNFFVSNATSLLSVFGMEMTWSIENLILPIGISFFTFQTLSYTLDIYRRRFEPVAEFFDFALFIVFFPQLVMGPIERAKNLLPQIQKPRSPTSQQFLHGGWLIFLGLYKKVFVADQLTAYCDPLFAVQDSYASGDVALAALLFTLQIYADFSGYADIARGSARMLGFELMTNFRAPYFARNLQDFWNRWHISLSTWIRDYIYYPLAVSKRWHRLGAGGLAIVTMVLMGIWHGANWVFVAWGLFHGILLAIYGKLRPMLHRHTDFDSAVVRHLWHAVCIMFTFSLVAIGEILFRPGFGAHDSMAPIEQSFAMLRGLFTNFTASEQTFATLFVALKICAVLILLDSYEFFTDRQDPILTWPWAPRRILQAFMLYSMMYALAGNDTEMGRQFQYFQF